MASFSKSKTSDLINVRDFLSKWDDSVYELCAHHTINESNEIADRMNITTENVTELEAVCSADLLKTDSENDVGTEHWKYLETFPEGVDLMCVRFQKQEHERRKGSNHYTAMVKRRMKYKKTDDHNISSCSMDENKILSVPEQYSVIYPDVILSVNIYRPIKSTNLNHQEHTIYKIEQRILSSSLLVLGRQKLTALRDMIRCVYDLTVPGELSENPDMENQTYAKDMFKSGFFFFEGTFYNDRRKEDSRDYSQLIIDWAKEKGVGDFNSTNMEDTTFLDLDIRLGQPYVYLHQGDCEHIIIFSDLRLLCSYDPQDTRKYPFLVKKMRRNRTKCRVCSVQAARWIVYGSEFTPDNPCFFCDICFRSLHYDNNNKKIGKFEAYRYFDHHAII